jgi:hypothetical protein
MKATPEATAFLDEIEVVLETVELTVSARSFLRDMGATVRRSGWVTKGQREALRRFATDERPELLPSERMTERRSRRWEGYERR